jgi:hypothetical protein
MAKKRFYLGERECAECGDKPEKFAGYDPDRGWLCPGCWEKPSGTPDKEVKQ